MNWLLYTFLAIWSLITLVIIISGFMRKKEMTMEEYLQQRELSKSNLPLQLLKGKSSPQLSQACFQNIKLANYAVEPSDMISSSQKNPMGNSDISQAA